MAESNRCAAWSTDTLAEHLRMAARHRDTNAGDADVFSASADRLDALYFAPAYPRPRRRGSMKQAIVFYVLALMLLLSACVRGLHEQYGPATFVLVFSLMFGYLGDREYDAAPESEATDA